MSTGKTSNKAVWKAPKGGSTNMWQRVIVHDSHGYPMSLEDLEIKILIYQDFDVLAKIIVTPHMRCFWDLVLGSLRRRCDLGQWMWLMMHLVERVPHLPSSIANKWLHQQGIVFIDSDIQ